ncbi:hypothetical protein ACQ4PT_067291 [Festuca glaucescens]
MGKSFLASSFHPPSVDSAAASIPPRYPAWVLLDRKAYFADLENATTATATSGTSDHSVKVTFCLADPPSVSHFCVHGPKFKPEHFAVEPQVVFSDKDLVLLVFAFAGDSSSTVQDCEYFIYKADRGNPSLKPIPATPPGTRNTQYVNMVACDDGEFFLAHLSVACTITYYDLSIFSSKTGKWITRTLQVQAPANQLREEDLFVEPHKVISLGGGMVGWVDLWRGVMVCNILAEDPFIYLIPLPKPDFNLPRVGDPKPIRDVTANNGVIKFVEMEHYIKREVVTVDDNSGNSFKVTKDLDSLDRMYDRDLLLLPHEEFLEVPGEQIIYIRDGWKIRTCYRRISWNYWRKGHCIHVDDILANNPKHLMLLPQLVDGYGKSTFRNLATAYPSLGLNDDHVVYLMTKLDANGKNAWMVGVDLENKMVEVLKPYSAKRASYFKLDCVTCAFSEFLNTAPRSYAKEDDIASNEAPNRLHHAHLSSGSTSCADPETRQRRFNSQHQPCLNLSLSEQANALSAWWDLLVQKLGLKDALALKDAVLLKDACSTTLFPQMPVPACVNSSLLGKRSRHAS